MRDSRQQLSDEEMSALLRTIDHAAPALRADRVIALSRARRVRRSTLLAAASVVLAATVATAAVPGLPLHALIVGALAVRAPRAISNSPPQAMAPDALLARGIAFVPGHRTRIDFLATQQIGSVRVRLTSGSALRITQTSADRNAQFALTPDGVSVSNSGSNASYDILIPATVAEARIHIAGRAVYSKTGPELSCGGTLDPQRNCVISMQSVDNHQASPSASGYPPRS